MVLCSACCSVLQFGIESRVAPYTAADRPVVRSRPEQVLVLCYTCFMPLYDWNICQSRDVISCAVIARKASKCLLHVCCTQEKVRHRPILNTNICARELISDMSLQMGCGINPAVGRRFFVKLAFTIPAWLQKQ